MNITISTPDMEFHFTLYPKETYFNRIAGVYAFFIIPDYFLKEVNSSTTHLTVAEIKWSTLLYIGITNNFQARLKNHHKISPAILLGMTHIGVVKISSGRKRKTIEKQLLKGYNPPLNQTWMEQ